jgi:CDP-glucose 4,6-dehydratase
VSFEGAPNEEFWRGRKVLVTGHTGFKGAWLSLWLQRLGAEVSGFALKPPSDPSLYEAAKVAQGMHVGVEGDVRDGDAVMGAFARCRPEVVFHMAAQPLVRRSYVEPRETFETNVMGTVNVLDAVRHSQDVRVVVNVTSDKCYENREDGLAFKEGDAMGGHDPYSASKGAAELVTSAYRRSFFNDPDGVRLASARAGNVIGGGDWGEDRLVADVMRAALARGVVRIRNPEAVRPWQHVLCPLSGYLRLAEALWGSADYAGAWNFGPTEDDERPVGWLVRRICELWPEGIEWVCDEQGHPREANVLRLDSSKAGEALGWRAPMKLEQALEATVAWWRALREGYDMRAATIGQLPQ